MSKTNYTPEQTKDIVEIYQANPCRETVEALAKKYNKPLKSVIGKLSREGVYRREEYRGKTGEKPITKPELRELIENELEIELEGLEKCPKHVLKALCGALGITIEEE